MTYADRIRDKYYNEQLEGHGRLIDADELMNRARGCLDELTILSLEFLVNGSSTIVPAEGGEADEKLV